MDYTGGKEKAATNLIVDKKLGPSEKIEGTS